MEEKITYLFEKGEFTVEDIFNTFSYAERKEIALEGDYYTAKFLSICQSNKIPILSSDEAWELLNTPENINNGVLQDTLADYLSQERIYEYTLKNGYSIITSRLTKTEYILELMEKGIIPEDQYEHYISNMDNDDTKVEYMLEYIDKDEYVNILGTLSSDEKKIACLHLIPFGDRAELISSFSSDEMKERYIKVINPQRAAIISSLESDERKEHYLNSYAPVLTAWEKSTIITSFENIELIEKYVRQYIKSDNAIFEFLTDVDKENDLAEIKEEVAKRVQKERTVSSLLSNIRDRNVRLILVQKLRSEKYIQIVANEGTTKDDEIEYLFDKVSEEIKLDFLRRIKNNYLLFELFKKIQNKDEIFNILAHRDNLPQYDSDYEYIVDLYANKYQLNKEHLITLLRIVGCNLLKRVNNENIKNTINLDDESFAKYLQIISQENMTVTDSAQNDVFNSFIQREFRLKHPEIYEVFAIILHAVDDNDFKIVDQVLNDIGKYIDFKEYNTTKEALIEGLQQDRKPTLDLLNQITNKYITLKRNEFLQEQLPLSRDESCKKRYEKNAFVNYFIKTHPLQFIIDDLYYGLENDPELTDEEEELLDDEELLEKLYAFKKDPRRSEPLTVEEKKFLPALTTLIDKRFNKHVSGLKPIPIKYEIKETNTNDVLDIIAAIRPTQLQKTLFNNEEVFKGLLVFLKHYRILGWVGKYEKVAIEADVDFTTDSIAELINNYAAIINSIIKDAEKNNTKPQFTLTKIMDRASMYDTFSNRYLYLFGKEDFFFLKTNPEPNSSSWSKEERIARAIELLPEMYRRKTIPVPPVDQDFRLKNGKKLNIVVGNTTDMINLTYGERTDACMRIGGAGRTLFDYCLYGKNGFHIRFTDPETGEFVSRVSCFRNGNTIFMNQLRHSLSSKYTDKELIEANELIAKRLIELTKDSSMPIENVVINSMYAMSASTTTPTNLGVTDVKKGLEEFYSDVDEVAIVVATKNKDNSLVPIVLNPKVPEYLPQRSKKKVYHGKKAAETVLHYHLLDTVLGGNGIDEIESQIDESITTCIAGEDWYISIDYNGHIEQYIMKNTHRSKEAREEMQVILQELKENLATVSFDEERKLA